MRQLLLQAFREYRNHRLKLTFPAYPIIDERGRDLGQIEVYRVAAGQVHVAGWALADKVTLSSRSGQVTTARTLALSDAETMPNADQERLDFSLRLAAPTGPLMLKLQRGDRYRSIPLAKVSKVQAMRDGARTIAGFLYLSLESAPDAVRWFCRRDERARQRIAQRLRSGPAPTGSLLEQALMASTHDVLPESPITVIVPVYNSFDLLAPLLDRLEHYTDLPWYAVLIDDASTDPRVRPFLHDWVSRVGADFATLIATDQNGGFVDAVNRGFAVALERGDDLVLLNSDAFVSAGWSSRLLAPMRRDRSVATVTPMSNDAEICNVPVIVRRFILRPGEADVIDAAAAGVANEAAVVEAPTGVGFCMAMNIDFLRLIPQFDPIFGAGYGEEVDWCQQARALGGRHLLHGGAFVEHHGAQSFGSEAKGNLITRNGAIVSGRYPYYDSEVRAFIDNDPLLTHRLALGLTLAGKRASDAGQYMSVFLAHRMLGGAETYLAQQVHAELKCVGFCAVIRVDAEGGWQVELHSEGGITKGRSDNADLVFRLFELVPRRRVVYSCGVGAADPLAIPSLLTRLSEGNSHRLEVAFNDFFPLSPSYTLLDCDGVFRGVPKTDSDDLAHHGCTPDGSISLRTWRAAWHEMAARADELTVFSTNSAALVSEAWPDLAARIVVRPHSLPHSIPALPVPPEAPSRTTIGILGNINPPKGANVLAALSGTIAEAGGRMVLLGKLSPLVRLAPPSLVHGPYHQSEIPELVAHYGIDRWLFPSVWPETFSYAIHEMLATRLPVVAFDLGAQGEALRSALANGAPGSLIPIHEGHYRLEDLLEALIGKPASATSRRVPHAPD